MRKKKEIFIVEESKEIGKVNIAKKYDNTKYFLITCVVVIAILFFVFGRDFRKEVPPEMIHPTNQKEAP